MKIKMNYFERVAGLFILTAFVGGLVTIFSAAIKQGWFSEKVHFVTYFENADGLHQGTKVQMSGLQAGSVDEIELESDNKIKVQFHVLGKFKDKVRKDSVAQLLRPFVIGERSLDLSVGSPEQELLNNGDLVQSIESLDMMQVLGGRNLGNYMKDTGDMLKNIKTLMEAFLSEDRTTKMVQIFDQLSPLMVNVNRMSLEVTKLSQQATRSDNLELMMNNMVILTQEINKTLPRLTATMNEVGPEMPATAKRAVEALNEMTILIKAMQKSILLRSNVKEVRQEEEEALRLPASKSDK